MPFQTTSFFHPFAHAGLPVPEELDYPHHYQPRPLAVAAAQDLQRYLDRQTDWSYEFGRGQQPEVGAQGKMFGVLVVEDQEGQFGYLAGFSGKLADSNHLPGFVPPVYDVLVADGFYKRGEKEVNAVNARVDALENDEVLADLRQRLAAAEEEAEMVIAAERRQYKEGKRNRKTLRQTAREQLDETAFTAYEQDLAAESIAANFRLKDLLRYYDGFVGRARARVALFTDEIARLKDLRSRMSNDLQHRIFAEYRFRNARGETQDLTELFKDTPFVVPPAGAGECAAPKLFQFAYRNGYRPLALAEFWWGQSPRSEIRRHGFFYPACRGKCKPILGHMLQGLPVAANPLLDNPAAGKELPIVYEDDVLLVVNKPHGFLSVEGKEISDSVQRRMRERYPTATGPMIVHRLDMSTSGLLLLTKTKEAHKMLQQQFFKRSIKKRYVAVVDGVVTGDHGFIDLPLRGDFEDRPRQIVCAEHGKTSRTEWRVIERMPEGRTRLHLWPVTGRTHQLRVHCAHPQGLNAPIVGDELYGQATGRLQLHAEWICLMHPETRAELVFSVAAEF